MTHGRSQRCFLHFIFSKCTGNPPTELLKSQGALGAQGNTGSPSTASSVPLSQKQVLVAKESGEQPNRRPDKDGNQHGERAIRCFIGFALAAQKTNTKRKMGFGGIAVFCMRQSNCLSLRTRNSSSVKHASSARSDSNSVAHKHLFQGDEEKLQRTRSSAGEKNNLRAHPCTEHSAPTPGSACTA